MGLISSPLRITVAMVLLWQQLGAASLVAVACILATVPVNRRGAGRRARAAARAPASDPLRGPLSPGRAAVARLDRPQRAAGVA
jgi:hypothetical protein